VEEVWEVSRAFVVGGDLCETWDEGFFHREGAKGAKLGGWGDGGSTFRAELDWKLTALRGLYAGFAVFLNILDASERVEAQRFWHHPLGSFRAQPVGRLNGFDKHVTNSKQAFVARPAMARKASRKRCSPSRNPPVPNTALKAAVVLGILSWFGRCEASLLDGIAYRET
jgi:hypothetical protein